MLKVISTKASDSFKFILAGVTKWQLLSYSLSSLAASQLLTFYICVELVELSN